MAQRYEKSEFLSFASCQLLATSNEDRIAASLNYKTLDEGKFSSFGVFDGHQGVSTSILK
jgi:serine/threonine protein phosphatase PrpC